MQLVKMKITDLHIADSLQPREHGNVPETVDDYAERMKAGDVFPPMVAFKVTNRPSFPGPAVVAGFHRHAAYLKAGIEEVEVELHDGKFNDAWQFACKSNTTNALPYSRGDRISIAKQAVLMFTDESNREIAERVGLSESTVRRARKNLEDTGVIQKRQTVTGKDGREQSTNKQTQDSGASMTHLSGTNVEPSGEQSRHTSPPPPPPAPEPEQSDDLGPEPDDDGGEYDHGDPVATATTPATPPPASAADVCPIAPAAPEELPRDRLGRVIPAAILDWWNEMVEDANDSADMWSTMAAEMRKKAEHSKRGRFVARRHSEATARAEAAYYRRCVRPYIVCPACDGEGDQGWCPTCHSQRFITRAEYDELVPDMKTIAASHTPGDAWEGDTAEERAEYAADLAALPAVPAAWEPPGPGLDGLGNPIPMSLRDMFAPSRLTEAAALCARGAAIIRSAKQTYDWMIPEAGEGAALDSRRATDPLPYAVCRKCKGSGKVTGGGCDECRRTGYLPKWKADELRHAEQLKRGRKTG